MTDARRRIPAGERTAIYVSRDVRRQLAGLAAQLGCTTGEVVRRLLRIIVDHADGFERERDGGAP